MLKNVGAAGGREIVDRDQIAAPAHQILGGVGVQDDQIYDEPVHGGERRPGVHCVRRGSANSGVVQIVGYIDIGKTDAEGGEDNIFVGNNTLGGLYFLVVGRRRHIEYNAFKERQLPHDGILHSHSNLLFFVAQVVNSDSQRDLIDRLTHSFYIGLNR